MDTDVLIVGGGLVGCITALMLAREGAGVVLVEEGVLNGAASGANAGSLHLQIPYPEFVSLGEGWAARFATALPLLAASADLWESLADTLGPDGAVTRAGGLLVATSDEQMRRIARKAVLERAHGVDVALLGRAEVRAVAPYLADTVIGGVFCPGEGKGSPLTAGPALAAAARAHGADLRERTALRALSREGAAWRAETSGGPIRAGWVVNAAGAKAGAVAALVGLDLAIEGFPIQATVTERAAPLVPHLVYSAAGKLTLKQMANGTLVIGGGWPSRRTAGGLAVDEASLTANMAVACATVPALAGARTLRTWPAIVNGTADWMPLIGEAPGHPGFVVALFPWLGFTAAPMTARIAADLALGRRADVDPALLLAA